MRFDHERTIGPHLVRAYGPGMIRIGEHCVSRSVIVTAERLIENWRPTSMEDLQAADLEPILGLMPEVLLFGTGVRQRFPERSVLAALYSSRLGFEVMDTGAACRTYNVLVAEGRRAAAALIIDQVGAGTPD
jgi:uncharacterized protein